jgi:hypothetical protein
VKDYERRDLRFAAIGAGFGALAVLIGLTAAGSAGALRLLARPSVPARASALPPEPRLQTDPAGDLRRLRAEEDAALGSYGWVDRARGVIRVPVARAMALLLRRGLPTRAAAAGGAP